MRRVWLWLSQTVEVLLEVGALTAKLRKEAVYQKNAIILCCYHCTLYKAYCYTTLLILHSTNYINHPDMLAQDG